MIEKIEQIIKQNKNLIAEIAYPNVPVCETYKIEVGCEEGTYQTKISSFSINSGRKYFLDSLTNRDIMARYHAAIILFENEYLYKKICYRDADEYFESDGHYEPGNTIEKNRETFLSLFPTKHDFYKYAHLLIKEMNKNV